jgi:methylated-DNA-[protein]-cysteine S-methyltransferase
MDWGQELRSGRKNVMYYQIIKVKKEEIGLVWRLISGKPQVEYIYLPDCERKLKNRMLRDFPSISKTPRSIPGGIDRLIAGLYEGEKLNFDLSLLNLSGLTDFAARVLKQTYKIPRGKAITYSGLAAKVGSPLAARAVGTVMANNPFPIVIPCHRVVRADGKIGQFGGGPPMKKRLLKSEGVAVDDRSSVPPEYICG